MTNEQIVQALVETGYNSWGREIDRIYNLFYHDAAEGPTGDMSGDLVGAAQYADAAVQRYALVGEYLQRRADGCNHDAALEAAKAKLVEVRRAMGYSYPEKV